MLPSPLLPAVVHFPIVFAVLLPIAALFALWVIRRGAAPLRAWAFPLAIAVGLTGSASVALQTGEAEEERVEAYVAEAAIHEHEEAAERFLLVAGVVTLIAGAGLLSGVLGSAARLVATAGAVIVLAAGVQIGRAGGELVYEHGAAQAYASGAPASTTCSRVTRESTKANDEGDPLGCEDRSTGLAKGGRPHRRLSFVT